ncbi:MAG: hypothetical protein ACI3W8_01060 [Oscillospiraceae bacterium]
MRPCRHRWLGVAAIALGVGIMITVIFPEGALLFMIAVLLVICGCLSLRH